MKIYINTDVASRAMKDVFKKYKGYIEKSRKQTQYIKDNWTFDKMAKTLDSYLETYTPEIATQIQLFKNLKNIRILH